MKFAAAIVAAWLLCGASLLGAAVVLGLIVAAVAG
jgi:hypothetical protein